MPWFHGARPCPLLISSRLNGWISTLKINGDAGNTETRRFHFRSPCAFRRFAFTGRSSLAQSKSTESTHGQRSSRHPCQTRKHTAHRGNNFRDPFVSASSAVRLYHSLILICHGTEDLELQIHVRHKCQPKFECQLRPLVGPHRRCHINDLRLKPRLDLDVGLGSAKHQNQNRNALHTQSQKSESESGTGIHYYRDPSRPAGPIIMRQCCCN